MRTLFNASAVVVIAMLVFAGVFVPQRAHAFSILGISGVVEVVIDPAAIAQMVTGLLADAARWVQDQLLKTLLATVKKRLLDSLVDETVQWIQGGGQPRFVQNFGDDLQNAVQAGVGDTLTQLGSPYARLCSPFALRLQLEVSRVQPLQRQVNCTLDQVVGNIDNFAKNFQNGGWVAYNEAMKPANNLLGLEILTFDDLAMSQSKRADAQKQETQASQGSLSTKYCDAWTLQDKRSGVSIQSSDVLLGGNPNSVFDPAHVDPRNPPAVTGGQLGVQTIPVDYTVYQWTCTQDRITTPGSVIATGISKTTYSDLDFIASADDLSSYIAAILDAVINRVVSAGAKGFVSIAQSVTSGGLPPASSVLVIGTTTTQAIGQYSSTSVAIVNKMGQDLLAKITSAETSIAQFQAAPATLLAQANAVITQLDTAKNCANINCLNPAGFISFINGANAASSTAWGVKNAIASLNAGTISAKLTLLRSQINTILARANAIPPTLDPATALQQLNALDTTPIVQAQAFGSNFTGTGGLSQALATAQNYVSLCMGTYPDPSTGVPFPACTIPSSVGIQ